MSSGFAGGSGLPAACVGAFGGDIFCGAFVRAAFSWFNKYEENPYRH